MMIVVHLVEYFIVVDEGYIIHEEKRKGRMDIVLADTKKKANSHCIIVHAQWESPPHSDLRCVQG